MRKINTKKIKRILLTRTDRLGDVLLTTAAVQAVRENFPEAFIAFMVRPYTEPLVRHNPYIDEVIVYDKYGKDKKFLKTFLFALKLRKYKFDISIMFHPTNRVHIISFLAGIPVRIGYDRKMSFLLTHVLSHAKQFGVKHEMQYAQDMLNILDIKSRKKNLTLNIPEEIYGKISSYLEDKALRGKKLIAVQPGASCPSKIWPKEKYVDLIKKLQNDFSCYVVLIGGSDNRKINKFIMSEIKEKILDVSGKFSILESAALIKFCFALVSNDSGPVHVACAVGTPVVAIFGRNQAGLSPKRWGPVSGSFIHKDVGCFECLAHNCKKNFKCIKSVETKDVLNALEEIKIL